MINCGGGGGNKLCSSLALLLLLHDQALLSGWQWCGWLLLHGCQLLHKICFMANCCYIPMY
jgi:hypothetical protein